MNFNRASEKVDQIITDGFNVALPELKNLQNLKINFSNVQFEEKGVLESIYPNVIANKLNLKSF